MAWKSRALVNSAKETHRMFRKPFIGPLIPLSVLFLGWYGGREIPTRLFSGRFPITFEKTAGEVDLLSRFRN